jgi:hypothetical protein
MRPTRVMQNGSSHRDASHLDLLGTPALVGLAHVGGGFDGGNELEDDVADTGDADDGGGNLTQDVSVKDDAADEDVD